MLLESLLTHKLLGGVIKITGKENSIIVVIEQTLIHPLFLCHVVAGLVRQRHVHYIIWHIILCRFESYRLDTLPSSSSLTMVHTKT